jgi:polyisoprenoid-binding protein YceI
MTNNTLTQEVALATYDIDSAHSRLGFIARHLGFSKVRGSFETFEGSIRMEPGDLSTLQAEATIETASITTNEEKRDNHLRSADFFDAEKYPNLTFQSTRIHDVEGNSFKMVGDLTIHGVTKEVELLGERLGEGPDPWGGTRVGFEARTLINRKDFGLNWNVALEAGGFLVGEDIEIVLEIQAVKES